MSSPRIALVGCGAIADAFYLPALEKRPDLTDSLILVDRDRGRAQAARDRLGAGTIAEDHAEVLQSVDGAIVATPHHLHTPLTLAFLEAGVHVLCEKPLSQTVVEVDEIIETASANGASVLVNHTRRLFTSFQEVQSRISAGAIGDLREVHYVLGEPFGWPAETNTYFGAEAGGRGVLFDTGAHIVDLVCWYLGGKPDLVRYEDDSRGGTEAVAKLEARRGEVTAHVHLSWLSKLRNTYRCVGTEGVLQGRAYEWSSFTHVDSSGRARSIRTDQVREFSHFAEVLVANFMAVIAGRERPAVAPEDIRPAVTLIDECYDQRSTISAPWYDAYERLAHV